MTEVSVATEDGVFATGAIALAAASLRDATGGYAVYYSSDPAASVGALLAELTSRADRLVDLRVERTGLEERSALATVLDAVVLATFGTPIGVVSTSSRATVLLAQAIFLPSMLLGGLMVPLETLPSGARVAALVLPTSWLGQLGQSSVYGREVVVDPGLAATVLVASTILAFVVASYSFNWDGKNVTRPGHPALGLLAILPFVVGTLVSLDSWDGPTRDEQPEAAVAGEAATSPSASS